MNQNTNELRNEEIFAHVCTGACFMEVFFVNTVWLSSPKALELGENPVNYMWELVVQVKCATGWDSVIK